MSLTEALEKGIADGLHRGAPKMVELVLDSLWKHPWYPFIAGAQLRLIEMGMKPKEAWELARTTCLNYVNEEKLTFGQPDHDWSPSGGRDVVQAYEIDHWESAR